jgi:NADPH:quinone reductase-like Zn-dependent oxidoreductase
MKAFVFTRYGSPDVLEWKDVLTPSPKDDEVLIRVHAVSINDWDWGALHGTPFVNRMMFGLVRPKKQILGSDVAGVVDAAGRNVRHFRPGDAVFGDLSGRWGGFAEFVCAPETALAVKPPGMTFEQAAAIPQAAMLAIQGLRDSGRIRAGQHVLINGAGGGAGTFAIQLAKHDGAEVTAVDHTVKLEAMRALGADHVLDYTRDDFTKSGTTYDLILDVKTTRSILDGMRALKRGGTYVTMGGSMARLAQALLARPWISLVHRNQLRIVMLKINKDLQTMIELFEAGNVTPVIDGPYPLDDLPAAFRRFGEGRHIGKVVLVSERRRLGG